MAKIFTENTFGAWIYYLATVMVSVIVIGGKEMNFEKHRIAQDKIG